jgi:hypothetical protein
MAATAHAQFVDTFDAAKVAGWSAITGDGAATLELEQSDGRLRLNIDATRDRYGVWWTCIKRDVTASLNLKRLADPRYELRVEARIRDSHAPRRVNFMINTQRTTNYHQHLREFDIADTQWHEISMTTRDFDAKPGDTVFVQFCATDWGLDRYFVDIDSYRADVVRADHVGPDKGEPLIYHPPVPDVATFGQHLPVTHDSVVNLDFPEVNFDDWHVDTGNGPARVLTVDSNQWIVLRWDFGAQRGAKAAGAGVLELTTASLAIGGKYIEALGQDFGEEFGKIHVVEILGGDPAWDQRSVSYESLTRGGNYEDVFNPQMTIDLEPGAKPGEKAYFTLPRPVMQRLLDGTTKGILIRPLGALAASVYASENPGGNGPVLHFSTTP